MGRKDLHNLSKRERQIMDAVFQLGKAGVSDIQEKLEDPPSYNSIRVTMTILEKKGFLKHKVDGSRYLYYPTELPETLKLSALEHLLKTLFRGSAPEMVSSLLKLPAGNLSDTEREEIARLLEEARREKL